ncbi:MAG: TRAP transporter small permease [Desulfomonilaceae bacterium]|nr:TRAP transporter small permease [Desulfomonilaceae bacterium]
METFLKGMNWVIKLLRLVGGIALVGMMLLTSVDVLLRGFGHPIFGAVDMVGLLAVVVLACAMPYTHMAGGHVGVDLLVQKMSPRGQAVIDLVTSLISLVLFSVVAWQMWLYAGELSIKGEVSMTIQIAKHPFIYLVSVCFGVLCLAIFADIVRFVGKAVKA